MNELATTIEQSKKLVELGLNPDTADMHYSADMYDSNYDLDIGKGIYEELPNWVGTKSRPVDIPAWSLVALTNLMPDYIKEDYNEYTFRIIPTAFGKEVSYWNSDTDRVLEFFRGDLLDASYNMVVWLLEHKHINTK